MLGNYSLTLIDSLSTLAILAGGHNRTYTGPKALWDFQHGIAEFVRYYGDGRTGSTGQGIRANGFDLDSKVQVFETVIRGVGGLLSAHLFAVGELPIAGYDPKPIHEHEIKDPLELPPIQWPNEFKYDGQLLRLAFDLAQRLLPAFFTPTGIPYPRVNLRHGIPFYRKSPLHGLSEEEKDEDDSREITETCSAGAGSLTLEFTVLSRLSGDPRFEQAAKRAFWEIWGRRSEIGLIGNGIDAERGSWIGPHSGIGAGVDSFLEYSFKSHILLSGHDMPNVSTIQRESSTHWLDPDSMHAPLPLELQSSDAFLKTWHQAHASVKQYIYTDRNHYPYYSNSHRATGQPYTMWIDSLGAFYAGLLALAGEVEEAIEANLVYTALWTRYSALPERWSFRENNVDSGIGWWPGRPEFIESTYYIYRATKDPWYLYVGEMVLKDITWRCHAPCGWAGLQDVRTGEKQDRMESFFLGETTKYMYLLFDPDHPLNKLDASFVFTTEGHPLIIPKKKNALRRKPKPIVNTKLAARKGISRPIYYNENSTNSCPAPPKMGGLTGSATGTRPDLFGASRFTDLHNTPNIHGPLEAVKVEDKKRGLVTMYRPSTNHTFFPWTLPPALLGENGSCIAPPARVVAWIEFPATDAFSSVISRFGSSVDWFDHQGPTVKSLEGLRLQLERTEDDFTGEATWTIKHVGTTQLAGHETVFFHAEHVKHLKDDAFTAVRRSDVVDIEFYVEPLDDFQEGLREDDLKFDTHLDDIRQHPVPLPSGSLLKSFLRSLHSFYEPSHTTLPISEDELPKIYLRDARTPVGPGACRMPSTPDVPKRISPNWNEDDPESNFPWKSIFLADYACDAPLPDIAARGHQVIVMRRGKCTFSQKIENIPSFSPHTKSLQLVLVVDEEGKAGPTRPMLEVEQVTPKGVKRLNGVPMVLVSGIEGDYERFAQASAIGFSRKYIVKSQGLLIQNAVVL